MELISGLTGWFVTIFALGVVIFFHEMGHLLAAKWSGVKVSEFSVGMGPKLFGRMFGETMYSLRLLPVGGYVRLAGLDDEEDVAPGDSFYDKTKFQRFVTLVAGSVMNLILGYVIFVLILWGFGRPALSPILDQVVPEMPAIQAGIVPGDELVSIDSTPIQDVEKDFIEVVSASAGQEVALVVKSESGDLRTVVLTPEANESGRGLIGVVPSVKYVSMGFGQAFVTAVPVTGQQIKMVFVGLKMLVVGEAKFKDMVGPIGIVQVASHGFQRGMSNFLGIFAMITVSLGIINLFPFPVLDGGHILFLAIEGVRGKRLGPSSEAWVNRLGAAMLITLMVVIVFSDILNWKGRTDFLNGL